MNERIGSYFLVEAGRGGTPSPASVDSAPAITSAKAVPPEEADGPAVRPYLSETSSPVAGDNEVAKGFPKFVNVDEASSLGQQNKNASLEQTRQARAVTPAKSSTLGRIPIRKMQYFDGVSERISGVVPLILSAEGF